MIVTSVVAKAPLVDYGAVAEHNYQTITLIFLPLRLERTKRPLLPVHWLSVCHIAGVTHLGHGHRSRIWISARVLNCAKIGQNYIGRCVCGRSSGWGKPKAVEP